MKAKYKLGDIVKFHDHQGIIYIIDDNGTFEQSEYPSYDILSDGILYKHVMEPEVGLLCKNPFVGNRLVHDKTFAIRLRSFAKNVTKHLMNEQWNLEEAEYFEYIANKLIKYQELTAKSQEEKDYLKRVL